MSDLTEVSETLFVPLMGRIYAAKHHKDVLYDEKTLALADDLPPEANIGGQDEYTYLASATRSKNMDHYVQEFLLHHPSGVVINVGCGLECIYDRVDNGEALFFELDLPEVLELRSKYFPAQERDRYLPYSMFDYRWQDEVKAASTGPYLVVAAGLFYYFKEEQVIDFIEHLDNLDKTELVFEICSSAGLKVSQRYMKKMGKEDAEMFFAVDDVTKFVKRLNINAELIEERHYYSLTKLSNSISLTTKMKMIFSDAFNMVKMIHISINK